MNNNDDRIYFCDMKDLKKGSFKAWCRDRVNDATNFYDEHKDMRFYDPSLKCWWQLNRHMTSTDKVMIAKRRAKGEKVASILKDMNLV